MSECPQCRDWGKYERHEDHAVVWREPPEGWHTFGTHVDQPMRLEFSDETDDGGMPLWERPIPPASTEPEGEFRPTETQGVYTYHPRLIPPASTEETP